MLFVPDMWSVATINEEARMGSTELNLTTLNLPSLSLRRERCGREHGA